MSSQATKTGSSLQGIWSLIWRATVLAPLAAVFGVIWLMTWPLLIILPVGEIYYLSQSNWLWTAVTPVVWLALYFFRRSRWFPRNRRDFPNEQENV